MNVTLVPTPTGLAPRTASTPNDPKRVHDAASQFEALMIGEMLRNIKEDEQGGCFGDTDGDSSADVAGDMGQEFVAQAIASAGGLGLASTIQHGLEAEAARHHQAVSATVHD